VVLAAQKAALQKKVWATHRNRERRAVATTLVNNRRFSEETIIRFLHFLKTSKKLPVSFGGMTETLVLKVQEEYP
jgi:hypothetical protein